MPQRAQRTRRKRAKIYFAQRRKAAKKVRSNSKEGKTLELQVIVSLAVIPAKAGIQIQSDDYCHRGHGEKGQKSISRKDAKPQRKNLGIKNWSPAFAGMTINEINTRDFTGSAFLELILTFLAALRLCARMVLVDLNLCELCALCGKNYLPVIDILKTPASRSSTKKGPIHGAVAPCS